MRIFVSAGEASGDAIGAGLVHALRATGRAFTFNGVGGAKLKDAGVALVADSSTWGAVGIAQTMRVVPRALDGLSIAKSQLKRGEPGLLIPIDFGYFNVRLARYAKKLGWKVLYFMPPGSWRRDKQGKDLPEITDAIVTPFSWSADLLNQLGANAHWFGHPLKQVLLAESRVDGGQTLAILPGSRHHEVAQNIPLIAKALRSLGKGLPAIEFAVAPSLHSHDVAEPWCLHAPELSDVRFTDDDAHGVLRRARAAIVCSGTATLEAALLRCPMVVVYRVSTGTALQAKVAGFNPEHISLPNLLLERSVVPEVVGVNPDPNQLAEALLPLLSDSEQRASQLAAFEEIDRLTGPNDAITRTAQLALSMLDD